MEIQCQIELLASGMETGQVSDVSSAERLEAMRGSASIPEGMEIITRWQ